MGKRALLLIAIVALAGCGAVATREAENRPPIICADQLTAWALMPTPTRDPAYPPRSPYPPTTTPTPDPQGVPTTVPPATPEVPTPPCWRASATP